MSKFAIGIDIGGTKIAGGVVDAIGNVRIRQSIPTAAERGGQPVLNDTLALTKQLIAEVERKGWQISGIGISLCELVDRTGTITSDYTIKWLGIPIKEIFEQIAPTVVEADVRAHALAEAAFGTGKLFQDFVFVSVGTGISSCLVQDGKPRAGANGNALVLSSMPIIAFDENGRKVEFTLEPFASGAGMTERYQRFKPEITRVEEIVAAAHAGETNAATILRTGGEALGSAVAWLVNVLDPEAVIVGGGLGLAGGLYWESAVAATRSHIFADNSRNLPILQAACGADAGMIGSALRIFNEIGRMGD